jgi:hypothetical protein
MNQPWEIHVMSWYMLALMIVVAVFGLPLLAAAETPSVPENVYRSDLAAYPGPWAFLLGRPHIIFVSDEQLEGLSDPDKVLDMSLTYTKREQSLRQLCEGAQAAGHRTLVLAFDHFFAQYRPGQEGKPRRLTPDKNEYVERIAAISKFAQQYGLGLELSLLSPLEIGPGYVEQTGESGVWMHYRKGLRDPKTGQYSVQLWRHLRWANNKGPLELESAGVRVFAFQEKRIGGTPYLHVDPNDIVEITDSAQVEVWDDTRRRAGDYEAVRIRVFGESSEGGPRDRVLVVQQYRTPEMDYFSDQALPYLKALGDKYADAGVKLNALYSDEMHIQQDWGYFNHHDNGEFAMRYVSPGLARVFAETYGEEYADFAKYLIYFVHGQEDTANDLSAKAGRMHVFGDTPEAIRATALFRSRYYRLLQDGVVELFVAAKRHLEGRMGYLLHTRAHATWAESPTIDKWDTGGEPHQQNQYEYTSNFIWSDTVHQAASACHDYFKWGDYLTGNGNDHAEGGWLDRDYLGLALACSTGILNEIPYSYGAHWGMPQDINRRRYALVNTYGAAAAQHYAMVQGMEHRDTTVLMLYPLDLVAAEERFGSWMTQYGYANLITQAKVLERGKVVDGAIEVAGRRFTTLCTMFEPFPAPELLAMMQQLADAGGHVVWSGPPPVLLANGDSALPQWQDLVGVDYTPGRNEGLLPPGRQVLFEGALDGIPPMTILTDFIVDRIYPVTPRDSVQTVARVKGKPVGAHKALPGGGSVTFLGFRPRDDQSMSLGYEERHWFEILDAVGAYPGSGQFEGVNDNPDYVSRTSDYMVCAFPNGAVAIAPHLRYLEECWPGGFARKPEEDKAIVEQLDLPSEAIALDDFRVDGHSVTFEGNHAVTFRVDDQGVLVAFCGKGSDRIAIDGKTTLYADSPLPTAAWAPVDLERRVEGGAVMELFFQGHGTVHIPAAGLAEEVHVVAQGPTLGSRGALVASQRDGGTLTIVLDQTNSNRWLFVVPGKGE